MRGAALRLPLYSCRKSGAGGPRSGLQLNFTDTRMTPENGVSPAVPPGRAEEADRDAVEPIWARICGAALWFGLAAAVYLTVWGLLVVSFLNHYVDRLAAMPTVVQNATFCAWFVIPALPGLSMTVLGFRRSLVFRALAAAVGTVITFCFVWRNTVLLAMLFTAALSGRARH
jgi:hypothetical protein